MESVWLTEKYSGHDPKTRVTTRGLIWDEEQESVVLNKEGHSKTGIAWELPGGGVDPHEDIEASIIREAREETGLETSIIQKVATLLVATDEFTKSNYSYRVDSIEHHVYLLRPIGGEIGNASLNNNEIKRGCTAHWLPLDEALDKADSLDDPLWKLHTVWALKWLKEHVKKTN